MRETFRLFLLFTGIAIVIVVRVALEKNGFTTPDSVHYINAAHGLLENGSLQYTIYNKTRTFTIWPLGYPLSIAAISWISPFTEFWNSRLVNLLWVAFTLLLFLKLYPKNAYWIGLIICMHSILDILSFTWSEGGFMVIMLWYSIALHNFIFRPQERAEWAFQLLFSILGAFLYRYFGGFLLGVLSLFGFYFLWKGKWKEVGLLIGIAAGIMGFIICYFWFVRQHTGYYSGTTRIPADEPFFYLLKNLLQTQLNEVLLIRKLTYNQVDKLAIGFLFVQLGVMTIVFYRLKKVEGWEKLLLPTLKDSLPITIAFVGVSYWLTMVILRFFMKFDMFDFRLLTPATFLFLISIHSYLASDVRAPILQKIQKPIIFLYLVALAHGLYKKQLLLLIAS